MQGVAADNLVRAIFQLEQSNEPADIQDVVQNLIEWLKAPEQTSLRRAFAVWIRRVLLPVHLPGQPLPEINNLTEVDAMLAEQHCRALDQAICYWTEELVVLQQRKGSPIKCGDRLAPTIRQRQRPASGRVANIHSQKITALHH